MKVGSVKQVQSVWFTLDATFGEVYKKNYEKSSNDGTKRIGANRTKKCRI